MADRIAITGLGAVTPLGDGAQALFENWRDGQSGIVDGEGRCEFFDAETVLSKKEIRRTERCTQLIVAAAAEAVSDAGWRDAQAYEPERIGCVFGTGIGGLNTIEQQRDVLRDVGPQRISPLAVPIMMPNAGPVAVAMREKLRGPMHGVVSACAAGAHAIGVGLRTLQSGDADAMVVGGGESAFGGIAAASFNAMGATSPSGISRPFELRRDGFVMGEGAGALVLERESAARERGAQIHGYLLGYGATSDAFHVTAPDPEATHTSRAITLALDEAGLEPTAVEYVNAHGTSTQLNDKAETLAIKIALGDHAQNVMVSSLKSSIGHLLGGAGAVEAVVTALALKARTAPPTLNHEQPDPELDLDYVPNSAKSFEPRGDLAIGISNSFGFGGHNAVLCVGA
jgi:3-oxoacyl-[acyl-carrier-protein] synthase II